MRPSSAYAAAVALSASYLLLGCSSNDCSAGSVCGNENAVGPSVNAKPKADATTPLSFTVDEVDPWDACEGGAGKVFLKAPSLEEAGHQLGGNFAVKNEDQLVAYKKRLAAFDTEHDAVPADYAIIHLNIQGKTTRAVTIKNVAVKSLSAQPVSKNALSVRRAGACGDSNFSRFLVNLTKQKPSLEFKDGENANGDMRVRGFPVQVSESDPENFTIVAFTARELHQFIFSIEWSSDGRSGTTEVRRNNGKPFTVASGAGARQYSYQGQEGKFYPNRNKMNPEDPFVFLPSGSS